MLDISRIVQVPVSISPTAAAGRSFGSHMIAGDSSVISGLQRYAQYADITAVEEAFGDSAPEFLAAEIFFGQSPTPPSVYIGRFIATATQGFLNGGILSPAQQELSNFTGITNGGFTITIDGTPQNITGLNFTGYTMLSQVVSAINGVLTGALASFDGQQFIITSNTTGISSSVSYATAPGSGTDISGLLQLTSTTASTPVPGYAAETPVECAAALVNTTTAWYSLEFAASAQPSDDDSMSVSSFIEALNISRIYGVTITNSNCLDPTVTSDLGSRMMAAGFTRSLCQYSSKSSDAISSLFGRMATVDFTQQNASITYMFKQEPGIEAEDLDDEQANTLQAKRINVFVEYDNNTSLIQYGTMSSEFFIDERQGLDWLQNDIQTNGFNLLYTSTTKIPQDDSGGNQITNAYQQSCDDAVFNGLVAPGVWTGPPIAGIQTGQYLKTGYYISLGSFNTQSASARAARQAPPAIILVKLAGAVQDLNVALMVNR